MREETARNFREVNQTQSSIAAKSAAAASGMNVATAVLQAVKESHKVHSPDLAGHKLSELNEEVKIVLQKLEAARKLGVEEMKRLGRTRETTKRSIEDLVVQLKELKQQATTIGAKSLEQLEAKKAVLESQSALPESARLAAKKKLERAEIRVLSDLEAGAKEVKQASSSLGNPAVMKDYSLLHDAHSKIKTSLEVAKQQLLGKGVVDGAHQREIEHEYKVIERLRKQLKIHKNDTKSELSGLLKRGTSLHSQVSEISESVESIKKLEGDVFGSQKADSDRISAAIEEIQVLHSEASDVTSALLQEQRSLSDDVFSVKEKENAVQNLLKEVEARVAALETAMDNYFPDARHEVSHSDMSKVLNATETHEVPDKNLIHRLEASLQSAVDALRNAKHPPLSSASVHAALSGSSHSRSSGSSSAAAPTTHAALHPGEPHSALKNLESVVQRVRAYFTTVVQRSPSSNAKPHLAR